MTTQFVSPMDVVVCSWWHEKSKKRLAALFNLTQAQLDELRSSPEYKKCVFFVMLYRRNSDDFEKWVKNYEKNHEGGMKVFGERMGLDPETTYGMVDAVRRVHAVIDSPRLRD